MAQPNIYAYEFTLKEIRESKGFLQRQVAAAVGVKAKRYSEIENGRRLPSVPVLAKLAMFFCTSMDCIYAALLFQRKEYNFPDAYLERGRRVVVALDDKYRSL